MNLNTDDAWVAEAIVSSEAFQELQKHAEFLRSQLRSISVLIGNTAIGADYDDLVLQVADLAGIARSALQLLPNIHEKTPESQQTIVEYLTLTFAEILDRHH